jgi:aldehyde:ferredoxin oxidoreductase
MAKGCIGKVLEVNLSKKQIEVVQLDEKVERGFIGGLGLGMKFLYDEVGPGVDPLSADNIIVIAAGPLGGTGAPSSGRSQIVTKSPLTGIIGTGNFGTHFGARLKHAGFGTIVIRGESDSPVYLWINDGVAELRSAEHIWGKDNWETTDELKDELGNDVSVLSIGQAGENLIKYACPVIEYYHAPGRSHAGCVMGAKKLKAVAVKGTGRIDIAEPDKFKEVVKEVTDRIIRTAGGERKKKAEAVGVRVGAWVTDGLYPIRNSQTAVVPQDNELWRVAESVKPHLTRGSTCYACPVGQAGGCDLVAEVKKGTYAGVRIGSIINILSNFVVGRAM